MHEALNLKITKVCGLIFNHRRDGSQLMFTHHFCVVIEQMF